MVWQSVGRGEAFPASVREVSITANGWRKGYLGFAHVVLSVISLGHPVWGAEKPRVNV